jgi:hypothetical protein
VRLCLKCGHLLACFSSPKLHEYGEPRWNDTDRGNQKNSDKNLSHCNFVYHISHMDWPGSEFAPPINKRLNYFLYVFIYVCKEQTERQKNLKWKVLSTRPF